MGRAEMSPSLRAQLDAQQVWRKTEINDIEVETTSLPFDAFGDDAPNCRLVVQRTRKERGEQLDIFDVCAVVERTRNPWPLRGPLAGRQTANSPTLKRPRYRGLDASVKLLSLKTCFISSICLLQDFEMLTVFLACAINISVVIFIRLSDCCFSPPSWGLIMSR